jgi:hypothetical protein
MYRWMDSTVIFLDRPSRNESNSLAASSSYRRVLLHASIRRASLGFTRSGPKSEGAEL